MGSCLAARTTFRMFHLRLGIIRTSSVHFTRYHYNLLIKLSMISTRNARGCGGPKVFGAMDSPPLFQKDWTQTLPSSNTLTMALNHMGLSTHSARYVLRVKRSTYLLLPVVEGIRQAHAFPLETTEKKYKQKDRRYHWSRKVRHLQ